jgi:hypothetical protein
LTGTERKAAIDILYSDFIVYATKFAQAKTIYDQSYYLGCTHGFYHAICNLARKWYGLNKEYTELRDELRAVFTHE